MIEKRHRGLSAEQRRDLWSRWKTGQSLSDIARALCKPPGSVYGFLAQAGGIAPLPRRRSERALTLLEREEISRHVCAGTSIRGIACMLRRAPSTISREIARNGGRGRYRAAPAEKRAFSQARRPKTCKLGLWVGLRRIVAAKLQLDWSPEQISGWLRRSYALEAEMQISHETIYKSLFVQARGVLKRALTAHLRSRRTMRRSRYSSTAGQQRGRIVDAISIRERPADVEDRAIPGHWEGDLISGSNNSHIATLVERNTRFTKLVKVAGKDTTSVVSALSKNILTLPRTLRKCDAPGLMSS